MAAGLPVPRNYQDVLAEDAASESSFAEEMADFYAEGTAGQRSAVAETCVGGAPAPEFGLTLTPAQTREIAQEVEQRQQSRPV